MKSSRILAVVVMLQVLTLLGQWVSPTYVAPASAQVPDAGAQRLLIIDQLKQTNAKLDRLVAILESGKLQVRTNSSDEKK